MDQRPQHAYPAAVLPDGTQPSGESPWPGMQQQPGMPIVGNAPYHAPLPQHQQGPQAPPAPTHHQFQFSGGYVVPGAGQGHPAPMAANGGTIGVAVPAGTPHAPMHGLPMPAGYHHPGQAPAHATVQAQQSSAWAYPTPNGLQMVQSGATAPMVAAHGMHSSAGAAARRRIRWEVIVPSAAVLCLFAAIGLFIHDFDRITGRDAAASEQAASAAAEPETPAVEESAGPDVDAKLAEARTMLKAGRYADATAALRPFTTGPDADARAARLDRQVAKASARNAALMRRLSTERRAGKWTAVIRTIGQIEQLRPLSPNLKQLRTRARTTVKAAAAQRQARARAAQAAAARPATGGGGAGTPPPAGGAPTASAARPPANVSGGSIPPRPDVAAPSGPQGGGAGAVAGGPTPSGGDCHMHDGQLMCS